MGSIAEVVKNFPNFSRIYFTSMTVASTRP
jgi:hypothetical protein